MKKWIKGVLLAFGTVGALSLVGAGAFAAVSPDASLYQQAVDMQAICSAAANGTPTLSSSDRTWANACQRVAANAAGKKSPTPAASSPAASPSPSAASPSPSSSSTPPAGGWPDATNTGYKYTGVTLHSAGCPTTITVDNSTYDSCEFADTVTVQAHNVKINRSLVHGLLNANYVLDFDLGGLVLTDVEIDGSGHAPNGEAALPGTGYGSGFTCVRCDIHGSGRGVNAQDSAVVKDSWMHDFSYVNGAHQSGVGSNGGSGVQLIHNTISCRSDGCSGAQVMYGDFNPVNDVLVQDNKFDTTGSYCVYAGSAAGKPYPNGTNIRYLNNTFVKGSTGHCGIYGPVAAWAANAGNVWTGNVYDDGSPVTV